jgi:hypothetical protein
MMLRWKDGTEMRFDDGKEKNFETRLNEPDLEDIFYTPIPLAAPARRRASRSTPAACVTSRSSTKCTAIA